MSKWHLVLNWLTVQLTKDLFSLILRNILCHMSHGRLRLLRTTRATLTLTSVWAFYSSRFNPWSWLCILICSTPSRLVIACEAWIRQNTVPVKSHLSAIVCTMWFFPQHRHTMFWFFCFYTCTCTYRSYVYSELYVQFIVSIILPASIGLMYYSFEVEVASTECLPLVRISRLPFIGLNSTVHNTF